MHGAMAHLWQPRAPPPLMNQSTDFTLVSYCVTRHLARSGCREGAPLMIHTTWWFKAIGVIERAVGSLAAGSCASLPPRLSSEEVEQLCTHAPADQSEICRRIAH